METVTLSVISEDAAGMLKQGDPAQTIRGLTTDSRSVQPDEMFVALRGDRFDGHDFVLTSARNGAVGALVQRGWTAPELPKNFALLEVDDVLAGYQRVAAAYRKRLRLKVIAITGSNGKTSTKDFTAAVLAGRFRVMKTQGNLNNHIGVPQTLLSANSADEVAVLELGMNHPGEIAPLAAMVQPDTAIITNIGTAHIEFMRTRDAIAREKGSLAEALSSSGHFILPAEDDYSDYLKQMTRAQTLTAGFERGDLRAESVVGDVRGSRFKIVEGNSRQEVNLPIPGLHMVLNALLAVAAGRVHGLTLDECIRGLETVQLTKGRLEFKRVAGLQILDDTYNANPDSMVAALKTLGGMPTTGRRIAVLGRMGELGEFSEAGHRRVGDCVAAAGIDQLIAVGTDADFIAESARAGGVSEVFTVADVRDAASRLGQIASADDLILLKGSRSAAMETIIDALIRDRAGAETKVAL